VLSTSDVPCQYTAMYAYQSRPLSGRRHSKRNIPRALILPKYATKEDLAASTLWQRRFLCATVLGIRNKNIFSTKKCDRYNPEFVHIHQNEATGGGERISSKRKRGRKASKYTLIVLLSAIHVVQEIIVSSIIRFLPTRIVGQLYLFSQREDDTST
jgi:hypothetical protein